MSNKNFIAVDIGGTKISIVLFCDDKIIRQIKLETNPIEKPTINKPNLIADNIELIDWLINPNTGVTRKQLIDQDGV